MSSDTAINSNTSPLSNVLPNSLDPTNQAPGPIALQGLIERVEAVIQQVKLGILTEHLIMFKCPISAELPTDPVMTNCGHLYNRREITEWINVKHKCPTCDKPVVNLITLFALKNFIADQQLQDPIPTCSNFTVENKQLATQCFDLAKIRVDEKDYEGALGFLAQALRYTNSSEDYTAIPKVYDLMEAPEKAQLSRLFLSLYQLKEGKVQDAIGTLTLCGSQDLDVGSLIKGKGLTAPTTISEREWADTKTLCLPPYPQELNDFLGSDCTIWPGEKRSATHIVVPLFPNVSINGITFPSTLESLELIENSAGGVAYSFLWSETPKNNPAEKEFRYAVMTRDVIPGSRGKSYEFQLGLLSPSGYEAPEVLDAARAILWEYRCSGKRCPNDDSSTRTYTRCKEIVHGCCLIVGSSSSPGLYIDRNFPNENRDSIGIVGWKKF